MTTIYLYTLPSPYIPDQVVGISLADDGERLLQLQYHNVDAAKRGLGLTSDSQKRLYEKVYGKGGYVLEWVENPVTHEAFIAAFEKNKEIARVNGEV